MTGLHSKPWAKRTKTYNSGDSLVVTHLTTNPPVSCLSTAERTGSAVSQDPVVVCGRLWILVTYVAHARRGVRLWACVEGGGRGIWCAGDGRGCGTLGFSDGMLRRLTWWFGVLRLCWGWRSQLAPGRGARDLVQR